MERLTSVVSIIRMFMLEHLQKEIHLQRRWMNVFIISSTNGQYLLVVKSGHRV